jgi:ribose/xylose/arabinose/galactoside ABC-type transport system permease subunit
MTTFTVARRGRDLLGSRYTPVLVTFALLVVVFAIGSSRYRGFASGQVIANLFVDNAFLIVLAVGMTFVILTGGIDLSVGSVVALSTMIAASLAQAGWPPAAVVLVVLVTTSTLGLLVGLVIHYFEIQPFIVTLAALFLARGLCYVISLNSISIDRGSPSRRASSSPRSSSSSPSQCCTTRASVARSTRSAAASTRRCSWGCRWRAPRCSST